MSHKLTRAHPCLAGFSLLFLAIVWLGCRIKNVTVLDTEWIHLSSDQDLLLFHATIVDEKENFLVLSAFMWITLPLLLIHVYNMQQIWTVIFAREKNNAVECCISVYQSVWLIQGIIMCVIVPALMVSLSYYEWNFQTKTLVKHPGFYIQYLLAVLIVEFSDAMYFAAVIAAITPWFILNAVLYHRHYSASFRAYLICFGLGRLRLLEVLFVLSMLFIIYCSLSPFFAWGSDKTFYASNGASQFLGVVLILSYLIQSVWLIYLTTVIKRLEDETHDTAFQRRSSRERGTVNLMVGHRSSSSSSSDEEEEEEKDGHNKNEKKTDGGMHNSSSTTTTKTTVITTKIMNKHNKKTVGAQSDNNDNSGNTTAVTTNTLRTNANVNNHIEDNDHGDPIDEERMSLL